MKRTFVVFFFSLSAWTLASCIQELPLQYKDPFSINPLKPSFQITQASLTPLCTVERKDCQTKPFGLASFESGKTSLPALNCRSILDEAVIPNFSHSRSHDFLFLQILVTPCPTELPPPHGPESSSCELSGRLALLDVCRSREKGGSSPLSFFLSPPDALVSVPSATLDQGLFQRIGHQTSLLPDGGLLVFGGLRLASKDDGLDFASFTQIFLPDSVLQPLKNLEILPAVELSEPSSSVVPAKFLQAASPTPEGILVFGGVGSTASSLKSPVLIKPSSPASNGGSSSGRMLKGEPASGGELAKLPALWERAGATALSVPIPAQVSGQTRHRLYLHTFGGVARDLASSTDPALEGKKPYDEHMIFHASAYIPNLKSVVSLGGLRPIQGSFLPQTKIFLIPLEGGSTYVSDLKLHRVGHTILPLPPANDTSKKIQILVLGGFEPKSATDPISLTGIHQNLFLNPKKELLAANPLLITLPQSDKDTFLVEKINVQPTDTLLRYLFQRAFHTSTLYEKDEATQEYRKALILGGLRDFDNKERAPVQSPNPLQTKTYEAYSLDLVLVRQALRSAAQTPETFPELTPAVTAIPMLPSDSGKFAPPQNSRHLFLHQVTPLLTGQMLVSGGIEITIPLAQDEPSPPRPLKLTYKHSSVLWHFNPRLASGPTIQK